MRVNLGFGLLSISRSTAWFRRKGGRCYILKTPFAPLLFSERYGYTKTIGAFGFRLMARD